MSFSINNNINMSSLPDRAILPIYNASELNNTSISDLENIQDGNILIWDNIQKIWTYGPPVCP